MFAEVNHPGAQQHYNPPPKVAKSLIAHAVRNMPGKEHIMKHCYPRQTSYHQGLPQHKHLNDGKMQWAFMN